MKKEGKAGVEERRSEEASVGGEAGICWGGGGWGS